jgi:hypothetical protein
LYPNPSPDDFGYLTITSDPDSAEIFVDGKFNGTAPASLTLSTGAHRVLIRFPGLPDYARTIDIPKSSKLTIKVTFPTSPSH